MGTSLRRVVLLAAAASALAAAGCNMVVPRADFAPEMRGDSRLEAPGGPPALGRSRGSAHNEGGGGGETAGPPGPPTEAPKADPERTARLVTYNADVHLVVRKIAETLKAVEGIASSSGGYMQRMSARSITIKVPAARFGEALGEVEALGELARKEVRGTDVTEKMRDLKIRLANSEEVRKRLVQLLAKCAAVKEALAIEKELARVTETVELLKGRIRFIENSVAFSTITVHLNSPLPQKAAVRPAPFGWVNALAGGISGRRSGHFGRGGVRFQPPESYVMPRSRYGPVRAFSADEVEIAVARNENHRGGTLEFWSKLVRNHLVKRKVIAVTDEADLELASGAKARLLVGTKEIGRKRYGYLVAVAATRRQVFVFQAWGPEAEFSADRKKLEGAVRSMRVGR